MLTLTKEHRAYKLGIEKTWDFSRFNNLVPDENILFVPSRLADDYVKPEDKKLVYYVIEEPNGFFSPKNLGYYNRINMFDKILTVCPYSAKWFNEKFSCNKWEYVFFACNKDRMPEPQKKEYDVVYVGNMVSNEISSWIKQFKKYKLKYRLISSAKYNETTNHDVSYNEKMDIIAKSKVSIVHNILFPRLQHIETAIKLYPDIMSNNEAFRLCTHQKPDVVPQLKSRSFEAAFAGSLMLCRKDEWNIIEDFFIPGKDFLYFEPGKMMEVLSEVLKNYNKYKHIPKNARTKALDKYTVEHFVKKYLVNINI
jgi:hypothetical protein